MSPCTTTSISPRSSPSAARAGAGAGRAAATLLVVFARRASSIVVARARRRGGHGARARLRLLRPELAPAGRARLELVPLRLRRQPARRHPVGDEPPAARSSTKMSPWLPKATVAIEDSRFWQHGALDYQGIARALYKDVERRAASSQGGSTITQQLVRNLYIGKPERTFVAQGEGGVPRREAREDAGRRSRSSPRISTRCSTAGTRTARRPARRRSSRRARGSSTLAQAALLAGLPQAPTRLRPGAASGQRAPPAQRGAARRCSGTRVITQLAVRAARSATRSG